MLYLWFMPGFMVGIQSQYSSGYCSIHHTWMRMKVGLIWNDKSIIMSRGMTKLGIFLSLVIDPTSHPDTGAISVCIIQPNTLLNTKSNKKREGTTACQCCSSQTFCLRKWAFLSLVHEFTISILFAGPVRFMSYGDLLGFQSRVLIFTNSGCDLWKNQYPWLESP